jgi:PPOX class probable FMN-dependent enzyme
MVINMADIDPAFLIRDESTLSELYGPALERSVRKQMNHLDELCRAFIAASPLIVIGTQNGALADTSPRGDAPGFVKVVDDQTLIIPDRRGNNRLDTLRNIVNNPSIGIVFFVPGRAETFRVNGEAVVSRDPALVAQFAVEDKLPRTVLVVKVREAYIHCSRALVRSDLWNPAKYVAPGVVPTFGAMMEAHTCGMVKADAVDAEAVTRVPATLY